MYTIIMDSSKNLVTSVKTKIYEGENAADKIQFLIPPRYLDFEISGSKAMLKYSSLSSSELEEELVCDESLYKDMLRYTLEVDSKFTSLSGSLDVRIEFVNGDSVLKTNNTTVKVCGVNDDDIPGSPNSPNSSTSHTHSNIHVLETYTKTQQQLIDELKVHEGLENYYTKDETTELLKAKENILNKTTVVDENSDDEHYPTAGAVYRAGMDIYNHAIDHSYGKGYINDFYYESKVIDEKLSDKADKTNTYTKQDIDDILGSVGGNSFELMTQEEFNDLISSGADNENFRGKAAEASVVAACVGTANVHEKEIMALNVQIGDIDSALDEIINLQVAKGGDAV